MSTDSDDIKKELLRLQKETKETIDLYEKNSEKIKNYLGSKASKDELTFAEMHFMPKYALRNLKSAHQSLNVDREWTWGELSLLSREVKPFKEISTLLDKIDKMDKKIKAEDDDDKSQDKKRPS